ncbi:serpin family protein [Streptomyces sp. LHD-70]|uniref:serpin family protein n=1 Tax=Streptomyces sp. LHD-70 TaxID=3072140 RepID=UPI00280F497A|nr:serpin family protein [Streptomyces sp. LHD-70]MDQ8701271.1 serpin family protein [Streptomyces sp. LHD-70]
MAERIERTEQIEKVLPGAEVRRLAERWLPHLGRGGTDFACSPTGLWLALASVAAGARGGTAAELRALLGVAGEEAAGAVTEGARALAGTDALAVATGVWSRLPVYRAYREALPDIGFGPMDPGGIDAWVDRATGGLVPRLPVRITEATQLVLVNALALKARWAVPFKGSATRPKPFTDVSGAEHEVATMHGPVPSGHAWDVTSTGADARVVELACAAPAAESSGASPSASAKVRFVLGAPGAEPAQVLPLAWAPAEQRRRIDASTIQVALPKLSLRTTVEALRHLEALGVRQAFRDSADFSGLSPEDIAVSQVVQETVVKIAEQGVEAAAATVVAMRLGSAYRPPTDIEHIAYDRPFGIVVLDGSGTVPLFTAWQAQAPAADG